MPLKIADSRYTGIFTRVMPRTNDIKYNRHDNDNAASRALPQSYHTKYFGLAPRYHTHAGTSDFYHEYSIQSVEPFYSYFGMI